MLEMGRALLLRPRLVLLDEPTLGLAPLVFREIFQTIQALRRQGQTILMVEQNAAKALEISDYAYVLQLGANRFDGSARRSEAVTGYAASISDAERRRPAGDPRPP
jgi:branched-chain amino acid transport system ATP-binding protein